MSNEINKKESLSHWESFGQKNKITYQKRKPVLHFYREDDLVIQHDKEEKIKCHDNKYQLLSECVCVDGSYFHKSHKDIKIGCVDGLFAYIARLQCVTVKLDIRPDGFINREIGYTKPKNFHKTIPIYSEKNNFSENIISLEVISGWDYKECYERGSYIDSNMKSKSIDKVKGYETFKNHFKDIKDIKTQLRIGEVSPSYIITEGVKYTFGVEIEVSRGYIPSWKAARNYNVLCIRDGSVNPGEENGGAEYVTGVMTGDTGVSHLQEICLELSKRCMVNKSAGVHIHLGNIDFNQKNLVNSYRLAEFLEDEIFSVLPLSRRQNVYCRKLKHFKFPPAICDTLENKMKTEESYIKLFQYISYEKKHNPSFEYNKSKQHPMGAKCAYNRETPRYSWINYVPAMFNTRGNESYTIEIRSMQGSTNFIKIKNWLLFFMAFMAFAERHPELIVAGITMKDVIDKIMPKNAQALNKYFDSRKELFRQEYSEDIEYLPETIHEPKKTIKELINT